MVFDLFFLCFSPASTRPSYEIMIYLILDIFNSVCAFIYGRTARIFSLMSVYTRVKRDDGFPRARSSHVVGREL